MVWNASDIISNPWNTTWSPYTGLLGNAFWLIPVSFIAVALYIKTRNPVTVSAYMLGSGVLLASGNIFLGTPEMATVYWVFAVLGLVGMILGIFYLKHEQ